MMTKLINGIFLGSNASGKLRPDPLLIHKYEYPKCLATIDKEALPGWNSSAWMTSEMFTWYFFEYFCPKVLNYLKLKGLPEKALLILDNAPAHPKNLNHPKVRVLFMPSNCSCIIQPMDQAVIHSFKRHYLKSVVKSRFLTEKGELRTFSCKDYQNQWKNLTILDCINHIEIAWNSVTETTLTKCCKPLWPNLVIPNSGELKDPRFNDDVIDAVIKDGNFMLENVPVSSEYSRLT